MWQSPNPERTISTIKHNPNQTERRGQKLKRGHNEGFSLVEVLVAIAVLAVFVIPTCSALVLSYRVNLRTESLLREQLAVSSVVETLMAEGITEASADYGYDKDATYEDPDGNTVKGIDRFPGVKVVTVEKADMGCYQVTVTSDAVSDVSVTTCIRAVTVPENGGGQE